MKDTQIRFHRKHGYRKGGREMLIRSQDKEILVNFNVSAGIEMDIIKIVLILRKQNISDSM